MTSFSLLIASTAELSLLTEPPSNPLKTNPIEGGRKGLTSKEAIAMFFSFCLLLAAASKRLTNIPLQLQRHLQLSSSQRSINELTPPQPTTTGFRTGGSP
jgi:hypothetical protein